MTTTLEKKLVPQKRIFFMKIDNRKKALIFG